MNNIFLISKEDYDKQFIQLITLLFNYNKFNNKFYSTFNINEDNSLFLIRLLGSLYSSHIVLPEIIIDNFKVLRIDWVINNNTRRIKLNLNKETYYYGFEVVDIVENNSELSYDNRFFCMKDEKGDNFIELSVLRCKHILFSYFEEYKEINKNDTN